MKKMKSKWRIAWALAALPWLADARTIVIGSKKFTESVILGELAHTLVPQSRHRAELGGTRILWNALVRGDIDIYPEYSGTLRQEILSPAERGDIPAALRRAGVRMSRSLGFSNTYALGLPENLAARLKIDKISDLRAHPELKIGFTEEFMNRADGWPGLRAAYGLQALRVLALDHDIAYRALERGELELTDLYSTDAEIQRFKLRVLQDDLGYFPNYEAVYLYRADLPPAAERALLRGEGKIAPAAMIGMNDDAKFGHHPEASIAEDFARAKLGVTGENPASAETTPLRWLRTTREHLGLVFKSLSAAILVAVPLGIWAALRPRAGQWLLGAAGVVQTIPALALLVMLMGPLGWLGFSGIGQTPALVALFLYSLLPVMRNTQAGLLAIPFALRESAQALGLPGRARLRLIELPMALPLILAGVKTAATLNIGFATLGALVGAGGYGQPILTGIRLNDYNLILEGAVPSALLALLTQAGFEWAERRLVPRGLRPRAPEARTARA